MLDSPKFANQIQKGGAVSTGEVLFHPFSLPFLAVQIFGELAGHLEIPRFRWIRRIERTRVSCLNKNTRHVGYKCATFQSHSTCFNLVVCS